MYIKTTTTRELFLSCNDSLLELLEDYDLDGYLDDILDRIFDEETAARYIYDDDLIEALQTNEISLDDVTFAAEEYVEGDFRSAIRAALFHKARHSFTIHEAAICCVYLEAKKLEQFHDEELHFVNIEEIVEAIGNNETPLQYIETDLIFATSYNWSDIVNDEQFATKYENYFDMNDARTLLLERYAEVPVAFQAFKEEAALISFAFQHGRITYDEALEALVEEVIDANEEAQLREDSFKI